ncbi:DsbA family protein [Cellulomonas alba]|uniref:Thioredoxin-like fold domain-containing protein n=1 Tax=Cellulomonas alba TaxID=3053467 RepID=A0ABT7SIG8_9CELL|nr:hypothetical protein [Cellulomonas alba]MDM7855960.1 hypothetical protein [Cellulomonas alba]
MSYRKSAKNKVAYHEREVRKREAEREAARRRAAQQRRRVLYRWTAVGLVVLLVVGVTIGSIVRAQHASARAAATGPKNMLSDGVLFEGDGSGSGIAPQTTAGIAPDATPVDTDFGRTSADPIDVIAYVDYRDSRSAAWWAANADSLKSWVTGSHVQLEIHPVALLDGSTVPTPTPQPSASATATPTTTPSASPSPSASATPSATPTPAPTSTLAPGTALTGDYSLRAAGALACVTDSTPAKAWDVNAALLTAQPTLPAGGLTTTQLVALVKKAGATSGTVASCIEHGDFTDWATQATARAQKSVPITGANPVSATNVPLIAVGGHLYSGDPSDATTFMSMVAEVYSVLQQESAATASPTAAPTDGATEPTPSASAG